MTANGAAGFVGRETALRELETSLAAVRRHEPQIVLVEGDAGIGKTALLRAFFARDTDVLVLSASGEQTESGLAFGIADQLLPGGGASRSGHEAFAVGTRLLAAIGAAQSRGTVAVVVDDVHWADTASLSALLFLVRRLRADPVLVVLAARPDTLDQLPAGWHRLLNDTATTRRLQLGGLTAEQLRRLADGAGHRLTRQAAERLCEHTDGNPDYALGVLAEIPDPVDIDDHAPLPVPRRYAAAVLAQLAGTTPQAQALIEAAAVLGGGSARTAGTVAGLVDPSGAIDAAVATGLVAVGPASERRLTFVHPLARAVVDGHLDAARRQRLHAAAARATTAHAAFRHRALAATDRFDAALAGELGVAAGEEEAAGELRQSSELLLLAVRVDPDRGRADTALFRAVELLLMAGEVHEAQRHAEAVRASPDSLERAYALAVLDVPFGDFDRAGRELAAVLEATSPADDPGLHGRDAAALAYVCAMQGDNEGTISFARRARAVAASLPTVDALAQQALAWSFAKTGRIPEALSLLDDCSPRRLVPAPFETELLTVRGAIRNWIGDCRGALEDLRAVARWVKLGFPTTDLTHLYSSMAEAEFRCGQWADAVSHAELALSLAGDVETGWYVAYGHAVATALYAARGDDRNAALHAEEAVRAGDVGEEAAAYAALARAHQAWASADWAGVVCALETLPGRRAADHPNLAGWRVRLAEARLRLGDVAQATALLADAPPPPMGGVTEADLIRLRVLEHAARGELEQASELAAAGVEAFAPETRSLADGLLAAEHGRLLLQAGHRRAAISPLLAARGVFVRLGAAAWRDGCTAALRAAGVAVDEAVDQLSPVETLTARERVVAELVMDGLTNREIAGQLYVSVKAVEYHVGNIFAKLGIHSRRDLTIAAAGTADRRHSPPAGPRPRGPRGRP